MRYPKVAVIGLGFMGRTHIQALRRLGIEVHGVAGVSEVEAKEAAQELAIQKWYRSFDEAIADDEIEVVHLCTPNNLHFQQAKQDLKLGNMYFAKSRLQ